ncbi:MAG: Crp/Fnr family transcriptional regulator [Alphaproteobacteria bacterium]
MALADQIIEKLPSDSILRSLTRGELDDFLGFATVKRLNRNETLIEAGDPGDSMMIVLSGTLKVCVHASSGREVVLDYLGPGEIIGEIAVFDGKPRTANVIAIENAELVVLQRRVVLPFLEKHPSASLRIIEMLCDKLRRTNAIVQDSTANSKAPRLALGILRLLEEHGVEGDNGLSIGFRISQTELGNYVNISRENVNRQLREWEDAGVIRVGRGSISIQDRDALQRIADGLG